MSDETRAELIDELSKRVEAHAGALTKEHRCSPIEVIVLANAIHAGMVNAMCDEVSRRDAAERISNDVQIQRVSALRAEALRAFYRSMMAWSPAR